MEYFVVRPSEGQRAASATSSAPFSMRTERVRDRFPTAEYDLSEYAWLHTGPSSWSAEPELDDPRRSERVRVVEQVDDEDAAMVDEREAFILSLVSPTSTVADMLDMSGLPISDVLAILASLSDRGVIELVRPASR
jgi:hypothetical protein